MTTLLYLKSISFGALASILVRPRTSCKVRTWVFMSLSREKKTVRPEMKAVAVVPVRVSGEEMARFCSRRIWLSSVVAEELAIGRRSDGVFVSCKKAMIVRKEAMMAIGKARRRLIWCPLEQLFLPRQQLEKQRSEERRVGK